MGDVLGEGSYAKVKEAIDSKTLVRFYIDFYMSLNYWLFGRYGGQLKS